MARREIRWPCEQCGAQLRFAPGQTRLACGHCGHEQTIAARSAEDTSLALKEHDLRRGLRDDLPLADMEDIRTSHCTSCGALIEILGPKHALECPFCASPVVLDTGATRQIKPQAVVPFGLSERQAREALTSWLGSLWFAPNRLLEFTRKGRAMTGIYVPYWTFDAETDSDYQGQRGDAYYVNETVTINGERQTRQRREIRWTRVQGRTSRDFDDILVLGSNSLPQNLSYGLEPWRLSELVPYSPEYLAGFNAEGYTVPLAQAEEGSKSIMADVIRRDVRRSIGGDEQRIEGISTDFQGETFKHILLPVWMAAYKYNNRSYRFMVNAQTGKVQGERPWSIWKILFAIIIALILATILLGLAEESGMLR